MHWKHVDLPTRRGQRGAALPAHVLAGGVLALFLGGMGGYAAVLGYMNRPNQAQTSGETAGGQQAQGRPKARLQTVAQAEERENTASTPAKPSVGGKRSLLEELTAAADKLTPAERMAEITRMIAEDREQRPRDPMEAYVQRSVIYMSLIRAEDLPQLRAMLENAGGAKETQIPHSVRSVILDRWAEFDETSLIDWMKGGTKKTEETENLFSTALHTLGQKWAKQDVFQAWDRMGTLTKELGREDMFQAGMYTIIHQAVEQNPHLVLQRARQMEDQEQKQRIMGMVLDDMAKTDFRGAMKLALAEPEQGLAAQLESNLITSIVYNLSTRHSATDFTEVMDYLLTEAGDSARLLTSHSLQRWRNQDAEAADAWMEANRDAVEEAGVTKPSVKYDHRTPVKELLATAETLPPGEARDGAYMLALGKLGAQQPQAALDKLLTLDLNAVSHVADSMFNAIADTDPKFLAENLDRLPRDDLKSSAMGALMQKWMQYNPAAASSWLDKQPKGQVKNQGIDTLVRSTLGTDPEAAAQWALQMDTPHNVERSLNMVLEKWKQKDVNAARSWVTAQNLPEATRTNMLKTLDK